MKPDPEITGGRLSSRSARLDKDLDPKMLEWVQESISEGEGVSTELKAAPSSAEQGKQEVSENVTGGKKSQLVETMLVSGQKHSRDQKLAEMTAARAAEAAKTNKPGVVDSITSGCLVSGASKTEPSIAKNVKLCIQTFYLLHAAVVEVSEQDGDTVGRLSPHWTKDKLDRFKLWSQNIGAHHTGRRSLDYRLRDASNLRYQAIDLVGGLIQALDDATSIVTGARVPWDEQDLSDESDSMSSSSGADENTNTAQDPLTDKSPSIAVDSELTQIMMDIIDIIDCLFRLSISVQNPAPHDRLTAATYTDTSFYEAIDIEHVRAKYGAATEELLERLGKANSHRRQYFKYRDAHHQKLALGLEQAQTNLQAGQSTVASSIPQHMKTTDTNEGIAASLDVLEEDQRSDTGYSQTSYTTSTAASERLRVPKIPEAHSRGPFECPFCFMMISVSTTYAWKKHVFSDLRPYICLESSCETPHQEYSRRHQWCSHLVQSHWRVWPCPFHCDEEMPSADALRAHLLQTHGQSLRAEEIEYAVEKGTTKPKNIAEVACPLCQEVMISTRMYVKHVGKHQEDLALFALPKLEISEDECSDIAEGIQETISEMLDSEHDDLEAEPGPPDETDTQNRRLADILERAAISPPESSASSDEDDPPRMSGRQIENLKELHEAISQIPQHREALLDKNEEQEVIAQRITSPIPNQDSDKSDEYTSVQSNRPAPVATNLNDRSNNSAGPDSSRAQENFNSDFDFPDRRLPPIPPSVPFEQQEAFSSQGDTRQSIDNRQDVSIDFSPVTSSEVNLLPVSEENASPPAAMASTGLSPYSMTWPDEPRLGMDQKVNRRRVNQEGTLKLGTIDPAVGEDLERRIPWESSETLLKRPSEAASPTSRPTVQSSSSEQDDALYESADSIGVDTVLNPQDEVEDRREIRSPWASPSERLKEQFGHLRLDAESRELRKQQREQREQEADERWRHESIAAELQGIMRKQPIERQRSGVIEFGNAKTQPVLKAAKDESNTISRTKREEAERERIMMENIIGEHALADLEKKQAADAAAVARRKAEAEAVHRWHLEQAVKKKQQEEEAVTELRHKMRDRLLASGVPEFQVEAIIDGKRTMPPMNSGGMMPTESSTTYTRMSRKHLSIEALRSRAIEYDLDKNPDYIIIKRWVPAAEQKELWSLTRVIRDDRERAASTGSTEDHRGNERQEVLKRV